MTLAITSRWEHDIFGTNEGSSHLVITISGGEATSGERAPIDLAFALDRSGSMAGQGKLELVKKAVLAATMQLQETDRVSLVTFDDAVQVRHRLTQLDSAHRAHLERETLALQPGGSTNLSGGWMEACRQLSDIQTGSPRIRRTLLLTDGQANVGITHPQELNKHARELRDRGISTSAIGVGSGFDEFLLSGMVEAGGGNFEYIAHTSELEAFFNNELRSLNEMVALNPYLDLTMPRGVEATLINAFPSETHRRHTSVDLRDLAAGEEVQLVFAVTSRRVQGESMVPEMHLHWTNPKTGTIEDINDNGATIAVGDASNATRDDEAAATVALELGARDQREAVKLDREGRYRESRELFYQSAARLDSAPATADVREMRSSSMMRAQMSPDAAMSEHERKSSVRESHSRSRGGRRRDDDTQPTNDMRQDRRNRAEHLAENTEKNEFMTNDRHGGARRAFYQQAGANAHDEADRHFGARAHAYQRDDAGETDHHEHRGGHRRGAFRAMGDHARRDAERHFRKPGGPRRELFLHAGEVVRVHAEEQFGEQGIDPHKGGPRHDHHRTMCDSRGRRNRS